MSKVYQVISYIDYWLHAVDEHSLQAPFIYDLYTSVIKKDSNEAAFDDIEKLRQQLLRNTDVLDIKDFGAGTKYNHTNKRRIADIVGKGITRPPYSRLLARIVRLLKARHVTELGTSVGINTLYLASADSQVTTFEGDPGLCRIARQNFDFLNKRNIRLIEGDINHTLPQFLLDTPKIDLAFIDANHQFSATIRYFDLLLQKTHDESCLIFDDIYWSKGMQQAWDHMRNHFSVTLSLDLYQFGILFFTPDLRKQHYILQL